MPKFIITIESGAVVANYAVDSETQHAAVSQANDRFVQEVSAECAVNASVTKVEKVMDTEQSEEQTIASTADRIVTQEVYCNVSQLVMHLINQGLGYDSSASFGECHDECLSAPDYSDVPEGWQARQADDGTWYLWDEEEAEEFGCYDSEREAIEQAYELSGEEPPIHEALEFWAVSDWLAEKLEDGGEPVARDVQGLCIWGRTESGTALAHDSAVLAVAKHINNL